MAIKKLGNKKYFIRITKYINKKRRERKFTGELPSMGAARAKELELIKELEDIKFKEENEASRYTFKKAVADYLCFSKESHRLSTYYSRKTVLEKHSTRLCDLEIKDISKSDVKGIVDELVCSLSHKKEILKYIRQVFELAIDDRYISVNPCRNIVIHGDKSSREKANKLMAMTLTEVNKLLDYMNEINHEWYSIFYVTFHLGLRSSEAVALEFEDICWERNHIVISKSWCKYKNGFVPPKNGTSRIVPLNKSLKSFLENMSSERKDKGFILPRNKSWINGGATKVLQAVQSHLGIKQTNYHSLRASFITILLRSRRDIISVQAMVGHRELKTTQRYIRLDATDLIGATEALDVDFSGQKKLSSLTESG